MRRNVFAFLAAVVLAGAAAVLLWRARQPSTDHRRQAIRAAERLASALRASDEQALLSTVVMPPAVADRTPSEQVEFLRKALVDEISAEGLRALARDGVFGAASAVFPADAERWAAQIGVDPAACVAFRLERNGLVAGLMLATNVTPPRVVRCNNVKQMARR